MREVLIVIASFADGYLADLLDSIKENTTDVNYAIQVVDNHKNTELLDTLVKPYCEKWGIPLHLDTEITGYGDALNTGVGVSEEDSKYVLYMDSDTLVEKGWLREMIDCYERHYDEGCRMVGPLVQDFNNKYLPGVPELYGNPNDIVGKDLKLPQTSYLIGVCILRRRDDIEEFTWDKNYFRAYWEDNDISAQCRFWGYDIWVAGKSLMHHKVNSSHETILKETGKTASHIGQSNKNYFHKKWFYIENKQMSEEEQRGFTLGTSIKRKSE